MSRSPAYDDHHGYAIERKQLASDPDVQQAKYFQALLDERHSQILREICDSTAALAQSQASEGMSAMRDLRRGLAATYRERVDLDRLRNSLRVRLATDVPQIAKTADEGGRVDGVVQECDSTEAVARSSFDPAVTRLPLGG